MKREMIKYSVALVVFLISAIAAEAATKNVFVHGRTGNNNCGTSQTDVNNYWGSSSNINTSNDIYFVGYDGSSDPRDWGSCKAQTNLWTVLYNQCTGEDQCIIHCHSAGCYAVDYFFSQYGFVTDDNGYDVNVSFVLDIASASGGSELADLAFWASGNMDAALKTGNARSWNHNATGGVSMWHISGYDGWWYSSWRLPGEDDGAVAFHTTCGKNTTGSYDDCNTDGSQWANHYVLMDSSVSGYNSGRQSWNRDHNEMKDTGKSVYNNL